MGTYCCECGARKCWCEEEACEECEYYGPWYEFVCGDEKCEAFEDKVDLCRRCYDDGRWPTCEECDQELERI